jgi:hypothetical protein
MKNTWLYFNLIEFERYAALKQFVIKMRINRANARQIRIKSFHQELAKS